MKYLYKVLDFHVVDGDTVDVTIDLGFYIHVKHRLRLDGINAPEMRDKDLTVRIMAIEARNYLHSTLAQATEIEVQTNKTEKYGRYLATLFVNGVNVNQEMLKLKLVTPYQV